MLPVTEFLEKKGVSVNFLQNILNNTHQQLTWAAEFLSSPLNTSSFDLKTKFQFFGLISYQKGMEFKQEFIRRALMCQTFNCGGNTITPYIAIKLAENLTDMEVYYKFYADGDAVIMLKDKNSTYIYNPELNPNELFTTREYKQKIKSQEIFKFLVDEPCLEYAHSKLNVFKEFIQQRLQHYYVPEDQINTFENIKQSLCSNNSNL